MAHPPTCSILPTKALSDSLLNLGNHLCYCASAGLFVFIPLSQIGLFTGKHYRTLLCIQVTLVCLLSAGLRGCQLLVLRVCASQLSVFTLILVPKTSCSFV